MKRAVSWLMALVMVFSLLPTAAFAATGEVIDAAIFCSDVHGSSSSVSSAFTGIKNADSTFDPSTATFVGDTQMAASSVTSAAQSVYSDVACYYAYGNHDSEGNYGISDVTGLLYGDSTTNYYIYAISQTSMASANPDTSGFTSTVAGLDKSKPLFIASHLPLHDRRGDSNGAAAWYEAISAAAEQMDIVFFWAHNHTGENDVDRAAFYVAKDGDETFTLENTSTVVTPNFTYMNAGFVGKSSSRGGVVTTVKIYSDALVFQDYTSSGAFTGEYSHNVEVAREFANSTDSGDGDGDGGDDSTTGGTVTYNYTATANTDGTGYILVSNGYALQNNNGTMSAVAVTVSDDGSTITFDESVDVSTILWTIDSDGKMMNGDYYFLRTSGSGSYITYIDTECASDEKFYSWTYADDTLTCASSSNIYYAYYNTDEGAFWTSQATSQTLKFYVPSTTSGGSTEGGDSGDSGNTGDSDETVVGDATVNTAKDGSWQTVTFGSTTTEKKTVYVLTSSITSGTAYLIANSNSAGSAYVVANNSGEVDATSVTVKTDSTIGTYIELTDATDELWTVGSGYTFKNGNYYLYPKTQNSGSVELNKDSRNWSYSSNRLSYTKSSGENKGTYYLYYSSNGWDISTTQNSVYFYVPTEVDATVDSSVTYSVSASDIEHFYTADTTDTETVTIAKSVTDGTPTTGTYSYEILEGGDDIITSIDEDGVITLNGNEGTAQVKVSYTWAAETDVNGDGVVDANDTYTIWKVIDVTATSPYYTVQILRGETDVTNSSISEKGITAGQTIELDSKVTLVSADGASDVTATVSWNIPAEYQDIATVDENGVVTLTGADGGFYVTATYTDSNGKDYTVGVNINVTTSQYATPSTDPKDFPDYPAEGAIRFDKTATAVGNFSETGIAQVELSMTGVPYTTGSEIDVVIMLDMTGSMTDDSISAARASAIAFADQIIKNKDNSYNKNRISVLQFNKDGATELWALSAVTDDTYADLKSAINGSTQAMGGTPYSTALQECYEILYAAKSDGIGNNRQQFCVFVSDGTPTSVTYITNTTTPTTTTTVSFTRNSTTYTQTVPAYSTGSTTSTFESSSNSYHEYWSQLMINNSVSVYGVYTSVAAGSGDVNDTTVGTICMNKVATNSSKVYVVPDASDTSALTGVFTNIAQDILQAATDVTVEDKITDEYTMIFDIPTGSVGITGVTNDFYIEFVKYALTPQYSEAKVYTANVTYYTENNGVYTKATDVTESNFANGTYYYVSDYTRSTETSVTKLYLENTNGALSAASDASGTAYAAPVFEQKVIGEKGTMYYWTTDSSYAAKAAVSYNDGTNTYYFIPYGKEQNEDKTAPENWYNMTSGAYANGTVDSANMSQDLVIATPYFVYNAATRMIYWTVEKLDTYEYALRYFLYLDDSATEVGTSKETDPGSYPTNEYAYITYTNFNSKDCRQEFPIPQLTWSGAQVSYVFYLVNTAGQPINKSGQVVDFANAVFVTDIYTEHTVWNKGADGQITADSQLSINWLANELLPTDYKVYDESASYQLHVYGSHTGESIFDYFTIGGSEAADISSSLNTRLDGANTTADTVSLTTTKVYNTKAGQKVTGYGTYTSEATDSIDNETVLSGFDFYNTTVAFAVVWQPALVPDVVVVDYGLDVLINVVQNDILQNTLSGIGLGKDAYGSIAMNTGVSTEAKLGTASLTTAGGATISIENDAAIRFSQNDMEFAAADVFYYESPVEFWEGGQEKSGYMYSSVTVIPATTIYYEEDFLTYSGSGTSWTDEGTADSNATQDQDRPGASQISTDLDADNAYGYDSAYTNCAQFSLGTAKKVHVDANSYATAEFTFAGTGFDVIGLTSNTTGVLWIQVTDSDDEVVFSQVIDTYYGYKQEAGDADGDGTVEEGELIWVVDPDAEDALYQVPVMKVELGTYGSYDAKITATYSEYFDHNAAVSGYDLYLDAIRIYDPAGNQNADANAAYVKDAEGWPIYKELRNLVIGADAFGSYLTVDSEGSEVTVDGAVFIDGANTAASITDYTSYGPNNELYLAPGQAVAFKINDAFVGVDDGEPITPVKVQLAIKTTGSTANVEMFNPAVSTSTSTDGSTQTTTKTFVKGDLIAETISTATDMYYDITELVDDTIVITNSGDAGIISITNLKFTFEEAAKVKTTTTVNEDGTEETSEASVASISEEGAVYSLRSLSAYSVSETTEVEPENPENPEQPVEPETPEEPEVPQQPSYEETVKTVVKKIVNTIKSLLGWLFK